MTLKSKSILSLIVAIILTAGLLTLLSVAYFNNFPSWMPLSLLGGMVLLIIAWVYYYIVFTKYQESLNPKKRKYYKKGNRKNSRKKGL